MDYFIFSFINFVKNKYTSSSMDKITNRTSALSFLSAFKEEITNFRRLSPQTVKSYLSDLKYFFLFWTDQEKKIKRNIDITDALQSYGRDLLIKNTISSTSIARKFATLKTFCYFLQRKGLDCNFHIKSLRIKKKLPTIFSTEEILKLLETNLFVNDFFAIRNQCILEFLYSTGVRSCEIINIKLDDIDWIEKAILIRSGKGNKDRYCLFGDEAKNKMIQYLKEFRNISEEKLSTTSVRNEYLFVGKNNSRLHERTIQRIVDQCKHLFPNKDISPHTFRHSFATHLLARGASLITVQKLLGHSNLLTTEIYTQVSVRELSTFIKEKHPVQNFFKNSENNIENNDDV